MLDGRIAHMEVQRSGCAGKTKRFLAMAHLPALALIGDDDGEDTGPNGWPLAQRLLRWARVVVLHATGAERWHYDVTINTAEEHGRVLMVECGTSTLAAWTSRAANDKFAEGVARAVEREYPGALA